MSAISESQHPVIMTLEAILRAQEAGKPDLIDGLLRPRLNQVPAATLADAIITLGRRFTLAAQAANEHFVLLAIIEFGIPPEAAEKLNLPTILGSIMGAQLPSIDESKCCDDCAFRQGTAPNQSLPTVLDVRDALLGEGDFMCHKNLTPDGESVHLCRGFAQAMRRHVATKISEQPTTPNPVTLREMFDADFASITAAPDWAARCPLDTDEYANGTTQTAWMLYQAAANRMVSQMPKKQPATAIPATMRHDAGAYARCSCGRYSLDPHTLSDRQPACECGKTNHWCGAFPPPGPDALWSGKKPEKEMA